MAYYLFVIKIIHEINHKNMLACIKLYTGEMSIIFRLILSSLIKLKYKLYPLHFNNKQKFLIY